MQIVSGTVWLLVAVLQLLGCLPETHGHGFLTAPKVEFFTAHEDPTAFSATIDGPKALPVPDDMHYGWGPGPSAEAFTAAFGNSSYKTLREFVMKHQTMEPSAKVDPECGRTNVQAKLLQPLPDQVVWQHGDNEGFTLSHEGPCEVWCDDERVFVEKNCAKTYPHIPAKLPFERKKCEGKSRLQIVWLALHDGTRWQVYMNCAPLASAAGSASKTTVTGDSSAVSDSTGRFDPSVRPGTVKPSDANDEEDQKSPAPTPTSRTSTAATPTPSDMHHGSTTSEPTTSLSIKPSVNQWSPATGSASDSDDVSDWDGVDCDSASAESSQSADEGRSETPQGISIPHWLTKPLQFLSAQEAVDERPKNLRLLEAAPSTTPSRQHHDHSPTAPGPSSSASAVGTVQPSVGQDGKQDKPIASIPPKQRLAPVSTKDSLTEGSVSASRDGRGSDVDDCQTKKRFKKRRQHLASPCSRTIPPGIVRTRKPLLTIPTHNNRESRKLEGASAAPTPTSSQQVINWQNGGQEVIAPRIADKAKADFEAAEKKIKEWRDKVKKEFGYA